MIPSPILGGGGVQLTRTAVLLRAKPLKLCGALGTEIKKQNSKMVSGGTISRHILTCVFFIHLSLRLNTLQKRLIGIMIFPPTQINEYE
jgi:hypothetical protein